MRSRAAGYDVFLVLEATIGFNKRDDQDHGEASEEETGVPTDVRSYREDQTYNARSQVLAGAENCCDEEAR